MTEKRPVGRPESDPPPEETLEIADERPESIVDNNGVSRIDSGFVQWQKTRIEQRLRLLGKWNPRKYGDKTIHSGDVDNPIAITEVRRVIVD